MTEVSNPGTEEFERFTRLRAAALLAIVLLLGGAALALMLSPSKAFFQTASYVALGAVGTVMVATLALAAGGKRWRREERAVTVVMNDEWRRGTILRASRIALITVLVAQYPFALLFGFAMELPAPRGAFAMAAATVTLGIATLLGTFLWADRE